MLVPGRHGRLRRSGASHLRISSLWTIFDKMNLPNIQALLDRAETFLQKEDFHNAKNLLVLSSITSKALKQPLPPRWKILSNRLKSHFRFSTIGNWSVSVQRNLN
jgi:hypothetical protein